jgi:hypothetical protein
LRDPVLALAKATVLAAIATAILLLAAIPHLGLAAS